MARPRKTPLLDPLSDLSRKTEILEREMAEQRVAIERLKELGADDAFTLSIVGFTRRTTSLPSMRFTVVWMVVYAGRFLAAKDSWISRMEHSPLVHSVSMI